MVGFCFGVGFYGSLVVGICFFEMFSKCFSEFFRFGPFASVLWIVQHFRRGNRGSWNEGGGGDQILEFKVHLSKYIHCTRHSGKLILCATEPVVGGEMSKGDLS